MEIVKFNKEFSPELSEVQKKAIEMTLHPKMRDLKVNEIADQIRKAMIKAYAIKGFSALTEEFKQSLSIVVEKVKNDHQHTTIGEVVHAIELGAFGTFNNGTELNTISPSNINSWINSYKELVRKEAIHKQTHFEEKQRIESEKAKHEQKLAEFERFIENGILNGFEDNIGVKASVYRHLDNKAVIRLDLPTKKALYKAAQEKFTEMSYQDTLGILLVKDIAEAMALDYYLAFGNE